MSYREALEDGVRIKERGYYGTYYFPPCQYCGGEAFSYSYLRDRHYTCQACKARLQRERSERRKGARM